MSDIKVFLKKERYGWSLIGPNGDRIVGPVRAGNEFQAMAWAKNFVSTWNWDVEYYNGGIKNEQEDTMSAETVRDPEL